MSGQKAWEWILFAISITYLGYELAFNSRIVDGAAGEFSSLKLEALEYQGRILSGIGIALLLLRFVKWQGKFIVFIKRAALVGGFAFLFMFFGQKVLVDTMVNQSTEEARQDAMYIALLKTGVFNGTIQLDDIDIDEAELDTSSTRSMLAIMGVMLFHSDSFIGHLKSQVDEIIDKAAENDARKTLPDAYTSYQEFQISTADGWKSYADGVNRYNTEIAQAENTADTEVENIYLKAANNYSASQIQMDEKERIQKSLQIKRIVADYFQSKEEATQRCAGPRKPSLESCMIKIEDAYRDNVIEQAGKFVAPDHWCYAPKQVRVTESIRGRARTVIRTQQDCASMSRDYIESRLVVLLQGGEPFLDNIKVADAVRSEVGKEGVTLPSDWTMRDKDVLRNALLKSIKQKIDDEYSARVIESSGEYLPPTLTQSDFIAHPVVQLPIKEAFNISDNTTISVNLSPDDFLQQLHKSKYIAVYEEKRDTLLQDVQYFGDAEMLVEDGKNYYRSIVVPPLAMSFSLFFGLLNLAAFIKTLLVIKFKKPFIASAITWTGMATAFLFIPMAISSDTVKSNAFRYFQAQLRTSYPYGLPEFSAWVINTQPIVYPIGNGLSSVIGQRAIEETLERYLDHGETLIEVVPSEGLALDQNYQVPGLDFDVNKNTTDKAPADTSQLQNTAISDNSYTFTRINESNGKSHAYSRELITDIFHEGGNVMMDISPVSEPASEKWVVYDKPYYEMDICIPGRLKQDSLRGITQAQWRSGFHGTCLAAQNVEQKPLPTVAAVMRTVARRPESAKFIVSLQEDITGEVYCSRYMNLVNKLNKSLKADDVVYSTPSIRILGCFEQLSTGYHTAFEMPMYSDAPDLLMAKGHKWFTRAEHARITKIKQGYRPTLGHIDLKDLELLLSNHPFLDTLIVDKPLVTTNLYKTASQFNVTVMTMNGKIISGALK